MLYLGLPTHYSGQSCGFFTFIHAILMPPSPRWVTPKPVEVSQVGAPKNIPPHCAARLQAADSPKQRISKLNLLLPGARFGPRAIRAASARQTSFRGFNPRRGLNPYDSPYTILDCGDIPVTPFDNALALHQMTSAFLELGSRAPAFTHSANPRPKLLTLGGDHSIALPALRALNKIYGGPIAVLHFDAHLDTWRMYFPDPSLFFAPEVE